MAFSDLTSRTVRFYDNWIKDADPRVEDWLLMSSPLPQTIILGLYVYFVTSLGPKLMENRKPFELRKAMITNLWLLCALRGSTMTDWMSFRGFEAMDSHGVIGYKALSLVRDMGIFQNSGQIVDLLPASAIHMSQLPSHTRFSRFNILWYGARSCRVFRVNASVRHVWPKVNKVEEISAVLKKLGCLLVMEGARYTSGTNEGGISNESIVLSYLSCESKVQLLSDLYVVCFYVKRGEYQSQALPLQFVMSGWGTGYSFRCDIVDYSQSPRAMRMVHTCWLYYFSKFIELLDTMMTALYEAGHKAKSSDPVTLYQSSVSTMLCGLGTFHAFLNTAVHVVMYSYYGLCAMGPAYQKYLWWKKHLTSLQLVQFVLVTIHIGQIFFMEDCNYQYPVFLYIIMSYGCIFLLLFLHFWYRAYTKGAVPNVTSRNPLGARAQRLRNTTSNTVYLRQTSFCCPVCNFPMPAAGIIYQVPGRLDSLGSAAELVCRAGTHRAKSGKGLAAPSTPGRRQPARSVTRASVRAPTGEKEEASFVFPIQLLEGQTRSRENQDTHGPAHSCSSCHVPSPCPISVRNLQACDSNCGAASSGVPASVARRLLRVGYGAPHRGTRAVPGHQAAGRRGLEPASPGRDELHLRAMVMLSAVDGAFGFSGKRTPGDRVPLCPRDRLQRLGQD
ncbi:hypothetical protein ACRRTK_020139 [Alexandromys fortis]